jgi:hypothetical protein
MVRRFLSLASSLFLLAASAPAQPPACPAATSVSSYRVEPIAGGFSTIVGLPGTVVVHGPVADDVTFPVPIPSPGVFDGFVFYGLAKTVVNVNSNGFVDFTAGGTTGAVTATNEHPGDASATPNDCAMAWHDDLIVFNAASTVSYVFGAPYGPQTMTIEWTNVSNWTPGGSNPGSITFQIVLYSSTHPTKPNEIEFRYDRTTAPPTLLPCEGIGGTNGAISATVGTDNALSEPLNVGVDATDRGAGNTVFPPCDLRLVATTFADGTMSHSATLATAPADPWCSIVGLPGTVSVGPACATPCKDDEGSSHSDGVPIPLPWKFNLFGRWVRNAVMHSNGFVRLGAGTVPASFANASIPSTPEPEAILAPFWDDLETTDPVGMHWRVDGVPGCRVMTFEWANVGHTGGVASTDCIANGNLSFQAKLFEGGAGSLVQSTGACPYDAVVPGNGNDRIEFHYDHANFVSSLFFDASVGAEDHKGFVSVALPGTPFVTGPPTSAGGAPLKVVITPCECGTVHYYGSANASAPGACLPEIKTNGVPPRLGNPFALQVVGASPSSPAFLLLDATAPPPGLKIPVPCGGFGPTPFGTFWVNFPAATILPSGLTSAGPGCGGCLAVNLPIPNVPSFLCATIYAQFVVVSIGPAGFAVEHTEGAKIVLGG